ncbi:hypothetical protein [Spirosoma montaniterrae]|nr:hypothetical protein [Spirosoma montaniterrae]
MNKKFSYEELVKRITGGQRTYSLEEAMPYEKMQEFNKDMAADRLEARRKAASSQRNASKIILNA